MSKHAYDIEYKAVMKEVAHGQVIPILQIGSLDQAAPSYTYIVPEELRVDGQKIIIRRLVRGIRKGVDWEVIPDDS